MISILQILLVGKSLRDCYTKVAVVGRNEI